MARQAVILAGGLGSRLRTVLGNVPKALAEVGGKPVVGHQLELCYRHGFEDVVLLLGHAAEAVEDYVGDGSRFGVTCRCVVEDKPLGTAGAVLAAKDLLQEKFLVMYCDTMLDIDLDRFWRFTESHRAAAALLVHPNDHPFDSDLVATDADHRITGFSRWKEGGAPVRNLASAALYIMNKTILESVEEREGAIDFGLHVFPELLTRGENLVAYRSVEYIKDLGTPARLAKVNHDLDIGKVDPARSGRLRPAVFLDRDGVINVERDGVLTPEDMNLLPGAAEGVRRLNTAGIATVVVTNQPYVAHGKVSEAALDSIHAAMDGGLARGHAFVDAVYYCPHHPHRGYDGERSELKIDCACRKPKPGMILRAAAELGLDLRGSWMIGDRTSDLAAARAAGLRSVLVRCGYGGKDLTNNIDPDYVFQDLREAADFIVDGYPALRADCENLVAETVKPGTQILIGGKSRSGKSTYARVLAEVAKAQGFEPVLLHLDCWLKDLSDQGAGVLERYDLQAVEALLAALRVKMGGDILIPVYDRVARRRIGERKVSVPPGAVVICEGAPALALKAPGAVRLAVTIDERSRRTRFDAFYLSRGESDRSDAYWLQRESDETPVLEALNQSARILGKPAELDP